jgi:tartrate dehydratase beta subunit/fumarate hydratase class I family protein
LDNGLKGFLLAAGALITCIVLSVGFLFARESQALSATSSSKMNHFSTEISESDFTKYDGLEITGNDVINLIKKHLGEYSVTEKGPIYIYVKTSKTENKYYNESGIQNIQNFTSTNYISPLGKFVGNIVRDANKVIIGMEFVQK